jgi:co-chaperonin GroES (HSP10)
MKSNVALPTFDAPPAAAPVSIPRPLAYHVIVEPREPPSASAGGIILAQKTRRANRATDTIGVLKAVGQFAWTAKTPELDWSLLNNPPQVGDWVIFRQHAGQKLRLRVDAQTLRAGDQEDEQYLLIMADTDIIGSLTPDQAKQFYSWA